MRPAKQVADVLRPALMDRLQEEGVHADQALQVHDVLGEDDPAAHISAAKHPRRGVVALLERLAGREEEAKHVDEVGAVEGQLDRLDPQGQAP
jgi:hypothetical protein